MSPGSVAVAQRAACASLLCPQELTSPRFLDDLVFLSLKKTKNQKKQKTTISRATSLHARKESRREGRPGRVEAGWPAVRPSAAGEAAPAGVSGARRAARRPSRGHPDVAAGKRISNVSPALETR